MTRRAAACAAACAAAWAAAAALSTFLAGPLSPAAVTSGRDLVIRAVGSASEAFGDAIFSHADVYFHGGVEERFEHDSSPMAGEASLEEPEHRELHERAPRGDWAAWINRRVRSYEHVHLGEVRQAELLPFFYLATRLNPRNLDASLTAAYWLDRRMNRPDQAARVLEEALEADPDAWPAALELGKLYLRRAADPALAERYLRRAMETEAGRAGEHDRVEGHVLLGRALRSQGRDAEAAGEFLLARKLLGEAGSDAPLAAELDRLAGGAS